MITCLVGSGGKTTLIHQLANAYLNEGKRVLITTSTHMHKESDTLVTDDANQIIECLNSNHYAFAGTPSNDPNKITALSPDTFQKVCAYADEVLVEADGSRQLPLKFPNENEPVIVPNCDKIIIVSSLLALGKPAKEVVHRLDIAQNVYSKSENEGLSEDTFITAGHIQTLLRKGYIEPLMNQNQDQNYNIKIQITNDGSLYQRALASLLQANMDVSLIDANWFANKPRLFICGGGHVAKELADIASYLDFRIHVMDSRSEFANSERFPQAEKVICASFDELSSYLEEDSYYAVVTPGHQDDYTCVKQILNSSYTYLGMIGSRKKIAASYERLLSEGITKEQMDTIHAPIGLPIGAVTPAEIAISILAEIIEIKNQKSNSSISTTLLNSKEKGVLCIIINKTGSAPRGIGSMMLVTEHGQIDSLGGGAIENQVIIDAKNTTAPCIKEYNLGPSDSTKLGMICGGTNTVLFIPLID